jgi:pimeloyl-ACP methyl ester carboxylesterase
MVALSRVLGLALLFPALISHAAAPWDQLPPTPQLPKTMASGLLSTDGAKLFYARYGRGSPVLLLHGGFANSNYWSKTVTKLVAHHYEAIVMDSRGHGRSTRSTEPLSYELMEKDVLSVLDQLHLERVDLVGWSDGGIIGLYIAVDHPQRLRKLFVYGANSDPSGVKENVGDSALFGTYLDRAKLEYATLSPTPGDFDGFSAAVQAMWSKEPHLTAAQLGQIRIPTMVADGAHEEAIKREHTEYLAHAIPHAGLEILPDASHFGMLQQPEEFNRTLLAFLAKH